MIVPYCFGRLYEHLVTFGTIRKNTSILLHQMSPHAQVDFPHGCILVVV